MSISYAACNYTKRNAKPALPGAQHVVGSKPHCPLLPFGGDRRAANRARRAGILVSPSSELKLQNRDTKGSTTHLLLPACPTHYPMRLDQCFSAPSETTRLLLPACPKPDSPPRNAKTSLPGAQHVVGWVKATLAPTAFRGDRRAASRARRAGILVSPSSELKLQNRDTKGSTTHLLLPACPTHYPMRLDQCFSGNVGEMQGKGRG